MELQEFFDDLCELVLLLVSSRGAIVPFASLLDASGIVGQIYYDPGGPLDSGWKELVRERCVEQVALRGYKVAALVWMLTESAISVHVVSRDKSFLAVLLISRSEDRFVLSDPEFYNAPNFLES